MSLINLNLQPPERQPDSVSGVPPPAPEAGEPTAPSSDPIAALTLKPRIIEALSTVYDPEIPVNIYDLGLIYDVVIDAKGVVEIRMTLTAPGCPAAQILPGEAAARAKAVPGVTDVKVEVVWDPPWDRDKLTEAGKLQLGLL